MHIVIITYDWPPRNSISVHRPYSWAKYWSEQGIKVTVLTAAKQPFDEPLDLSLPQLPISIIETSNKKKGANFLSKIFKIPWVRSISKSLISLLTKKLNIIIDPRASWCLATKPYAIKLSKNADYVISTFGPASAHLIAMDMKKINPKIKWIADYRDLWSNNYMLKISEKLRKSIVSEEMSSVGEYADKITTVSEDMVNKLSYLLKKPVYKVPNGFDADEKKIKKISSKINIKIKKPLRIIYTGMIYRVFRDPKPLLDAISHLIETNQINFGDITVDFYGDRIEVAKEYAQQSKFKPFVRIMGHVKREIALDAQKNAGILLLLESSHPDARGTLTGKLFEYMVAGRPILCVGSCPEYEIGQVLSQTGTGIVVGPNEIKNLPEILLELIKKPTNVSWYKPNIDEILKYSRRKLALEMLSEIKKM
jgi:glycosyltransferase involved in cell wall biosynthesis